MGVSGILLMRYRGVTLGLHWGDTRVLEGCYRGVTVGLKLCYIIATMMLQGCYRDITGKAVELC